MPDPRLAWFAIGALFGAVLIGCPWHSRFSRYSRRGNPPPPGRKPAPPAGPPEQPIRFDEGPTQRGNIQRGRNP